MASPTRKNPAKTECSSLFLCSLSLWFNWTPLCAMRTEVYKCYAQGPLQTWSSTGESPRASRFSPSMVGRLVLQNVVDTWESPLRPLACGGFPLSCTTGTAGIAYEARGRDDVKAVDTAASHTITLVPGSITATACSIHRPSYPLGEARCGGVQRREVRESTLGMPPQRWWLVVKLFAKPTVPGERPAKH